MQVIPLLMGSLCSAFEAAGVGGNLNSFLTHDIISYRRFAGTLADLEYTLASAGKQKNLQQ